ncbi:Hypothetical predicted protein [Olea europaea subsp. europaea]|uniref:Uncharacterized protein n=1 Tax=Olea europaea subsp. europaea TaxID=158383 RepID=A0A8S0T5H7_OLEEU|nr:Hypothetical predicted protein [Olea europaea subsp. europaea]
MPGMQARFWAFKGHVTQATPRTQADFQAFLGSLWLTVCTPVVVSLDGKLARADMCRSPRLQSLQRRVLVVAWTQAHFQAFSGTFRHRCAGHVRDAGTSSGISRQFLGQGVQAMSGTKARLWAILGHDAQTTPRTWADFQAFFGSLWHIVYRPCPGQALVATGTLTFFRHMKAARCAGHVRDASTFSGIFGLFLGYSA